jgi:two-component system, cell cycle sensor histidine kinase and response regulator CckA
MTYDSQCGTILVVDDNHDICAFAKSVLEAAGYGVITADGAEEAHRFYTAQHWYAERQWCKDHPSKIVLLLTDVAMPDINGFQLADRVHAMDSQLPVLFMTGGAWLSYRGLECIAKPFRSVELIEKVSRALHPNTRQERTAPAA